MSDCDGYAITVIAFIGSVFSPYYAFAGRARPQNHVSFNVALYGRGAGRWAMTERGERALEQSEASLRIGPSWMSWNGDTLDIWFDEIGCPVPRRVRGRVRVISQGLNPQRFCLDQGGCHRWQPIAATARIEVELDRPQLKWRGSGYFDTNDGDEPLELGFKGWNWCRAAVSSGTVIQYDAVAVDGLPSALSLHLDRQGRIEPIQLEEAHRLGKTAIWRIPRAVRTERGGNAAVKKTLEDTPFYSRSLLDIDVLGQRATAVHESLGLERLSTNIVKAMLPFRMPRRLG